MCLDDVRYNEGNEGEQTMHGVLLLRNDHLRFSYSRWAENGCMLLTHMMAGEP